MKIMLTLAVIVCIMLNGCSGWEKCKTAPWNETQIEQMVDSDTETVPIAKISF